MIDRSRIFLSKADVAKVTGLSLAKVNTILDRDEKKEEPLSDDDLVPCRPSLLPKHIDFLVSKVSLARDAHLSLMQRGKKFNMNFDDYHMTYYRIRQLFK